MSEETNKKPESVSDEPIGDRELEMLQDGAGAFLPPRRQKILARTVRDLRREVLDLRKREGSAALALGVLVRAVRFDDTVEDRDERIAVALELADAALSPQKGGES